MLNEKDVLKIKKYYYERGYKITHISRVMNITLNTVKKYIKEGYSPFVPHNKSQSKITTYIPIIKQWLSEDKKYHYKQRHTAKRVHDRLKEEYPEYDLGYPALTKTYNEIKKELFSSEEPTPSLDAVRAGECKVELKKIPFIINDKLINGYMLVVVFPYSLARFIQLLPQSNEEYLIKALTDIFYHIGYFPHTITFCKNTSFLYKLNQRLNTKTFSELYLKFKLCYDFKDNFIYGLYSNTYIANKVARDFLNNTSEFKTIEACNKNLLKENKLNYQKYAKKETPILRLFKTDIKNMRPFKKKITIEKYAKRRVNKFAYLTIDNNIYFLPQRYKQFEIYVKYLPDELQFYTLAGELISAHTRLYDKNKKSINWQENLSALIRKPNALLHCDLALHFPHNMYAYLSTLDSTGKKQFVINLNKLTKVTNINKAILILNNILKKNSCIKDETVDEAVKKYNVKSDKSN